MYISVIEYPKENCRLFGSSGAPWLLGGALVQ